MKNLLKMAVVALVLSCFQAYGTSVCNWWDAGVEAIYHHWGSMNSRIFRCDNIDCLKNPNKNDIRVLYNHERAGYYAVFYDNEGKKRKIFIPYNC